MRLKALRRTMIRPCPYWNNCKTWSEAIKRTCLSRSRLTNSCSKLPPSNLRLQVCRNKQASTPSNLPCDYGEMLSTVSVMCFKPFVLYTSLNYIFNLECYKQNLLCVLLLLSAVSQNFGKTFALILYGCPRVGCGDIACHVTTDNETHLESCEGLGFFCQKYHQLCYTWYLDSYRIVGHLLVVNCKSSGW